MKILMTSETYLPRIGGAEVHVNNLFLKLKSSGHDVTLVTNELSEINDEVIRLPWSGKHIPSVLLRIWKESKGVSVIHSHYSHRLAMLSGFVGRLRRVPVIITLHGMGILDLPNSGKVAKLKHGIYRYLSLKLATHIISTSNDLALIADRYISRKKITIIMNGYDADRFNVNNPSINKVESLRFQGKKILMSVRRLVPKNGPHYLIESLPQLIKAVPNAHYVVVGDGPLRKQMEKRVCDLGLAEYVTFVGMVDNIEVVNYLSLANIVVFPSTAESSSIACAEAMGMGKIVVASKVGGLVELLGENEERGYLVDLVPWTGSNYDAPKSLPSTSYANLAKSIELACTDNNGNRAKISNALSFAQTRLSWDAVFQETVIIYQKSAKAR